MSFVAFATRKACRPLWALLVCGILAPNVAAQDAPPATISQPTFDLVWQRVLAEAAPKLKIATTPAERTLIYRQAFDRFVQAPEVLKERASAEYQEGVRMLVNELPESATAQSVNAPLTNPAANLVVERSGLSDLIAFAADVRPFVSSDKTAVSINLNAFALVGEQRLGNRTPQFKYGRREEWRRLGGTLTFGAKVPEKAITGISGLPTADVLFDASSWDVKVRLIGDRDVRASRWRPLLLDELGVITELSARVLASPITPVASLGEIRQATQDYLGEKLRNATDQIANSLQVSTKVAGQHLMNEKGKDKYSFAVMLDKGFAGVDFTGNVVYGYATGLEAAATEEYQAKDWQVAFGVTGSILKDKIFPGRSVELSAGFNGFFPVDIEVLPIERRRVLKASFSAALPFQLNGKIPISVTYANDPSNLAKEDYVTGQIGISYDFGAIWNVLKNP